MSTIPAAGRRLRTNERGAVSVPALLALALLAAIGYTVAGAVAADSDRYGRVGVPSNSYLSLPASEAGISLVKPNGDTGADRRVRVQVIDPRTREPLQVAVRGGDPSGEEGQVRQPIAAVDPPRAGLYQVLVTGPGAASGAEVSFGQSPAGAVSERIGEVGDLVIGPYGLLAVLLILLVSQMPRLHRQLARSG